MHQNRSTLICIWGPWKLVRVVEGFQPWSAFLRFFISCAINAKSGYLFLSFAAIQFFFLLSLSPFCLKNSAVHNFDDLSHLILSKFSIPHSNTGRILKKKEKNSSGGLLNKTMKNELNLLHYFLRHQIKLNVMVYSCQNLTTTKTHPSTLFPLPQACWDPQWLRQKQAYIYRCWSWSPQPKSGRG